MRSGIDKVVVHYANGKRVTLLYANWEVVMGKTMNGDQVVAISGRGAKRPKRPKRVEPKEEK